jgi:hypothetical protein
MYSSYAAPSDVALHVPSDARFMANVRLHSLARLPVELKGIAVAQATAIDEGAIRVHTSQEDIAAALFRAPSSAVAAARALAPLFGLSPDADLLGGAGRLIPVNSSLLLPPIECSAPLAASGSSLLIGSASVRYSLDSDHEDHALPEAATRLLSQEISVPYSSLPLVAVHDSPIKVVLDPPTSGFVGVPLTLSLSIENNSRHIQSIQLQLEGFSLPPQVSSNAEFQLRAGTPSSTVDLLPKQSRQFSWSLVAYSPGAISLPVITLRALGERNETDHATIQSLTPLSPLAIPPAVRIVEAAGLNALSHAQIVTKAPALASRDSFSVLSPALLVYGIQFGKRIAISVS